MRFILILIALCISATNLLAEEYGYASFYSMRFQGKRTASGELYNESKLTASHKSLPFGTLIKVTRLDNNKSVQVRINDRGPFVSGRVTDLSKAAANSLNFVDGETKVRIDVIEMPNGAPIQNESPSDIVDVPATPEFTSKGSGSVTVAPKAVTKASKKSPKSKAKLTAKGIPTSYNNLVTPKQYETFGLYKIQLIRPEDKGYAVQVASINKYENVLKYIADLQGKYFKNILVSVEKGADNKPEYKVMLGPFGDMKAAASYANNAKKKKINGFVVNLTDIKY